MDSGAMGIALDLGQSMIAINPISHHVFLFSLLEGLFLDSPEKKGGGAQKWWMGPQVMAFLLENLRF